MSNMAVFRSITNIMEHKFKFYFTLSEIDLSRLLGSEFIDQPRVV